jgi:hypothetical protein
MTLADFFENTAAAALLRVVSGGSLCRHPKVTSPEKVPSLEPLAEFTTSEGDRDAEQDERLRADSLENRRREEKTSPADVGDEQDEWLVTWVGDNDPANPKNFSSFGKIFVLCEVCCIGHDLSKSLTRRRLEYSHSLSPAHLRYILAAC